MIHPVANFIVSYFYWLFLAVLVLNLTQRRYRAQAQRKRYATLYLAIFVFVLYIYGYLLIRFNLSDWFLLVYLAVVGALLWGFRRTFLPFRLRCRSCSRSLSFDRVVYFDSNLCEACEQARRASDEPAGSVEEDASGEGSPGEG